MSDEENKAIEKFRTLNIKHFNLETIYENDLLSYYDGILILNLIEKQQDELSKKDKAIQKTIKYLETYPYVAYTLNGDILHNSENAIKILKGEEIDEHLEGDIW